MKTKKYIKKANINRNKFTYPVVQLDDLTDFLKRKSFLRLLSEHLFLKQEGAICLLDIDDFKNINDVYGHRFGDLVIETIAERIDGKSACDKFIARLNGDEFVIAFIDNSHQNNTRTEIQELIKKISLPMSIEGKTVFISISAGVSLFPLNSVDAEELIMYSEMAMYEAKKLGKNQVVYFNSTMNEHLKLHTEIDEILKVQDKENIFTMVYQPIVNAVTKKIVSFEALIRMKDRKYSPMEFIGIAETTGEIQALGRWITEEVIKQISLWNMQGISAVPIAINFSCKQMLDHGYLSFFENTLDKYGVLPTQVVIEITESVFMDIRYNGVNFINEFKKMGVIVALDDFGTGYSSLIYLTNINFDKVKLDRSFIQKLIDDKSVKVLSGIIHMLHSIDVSVVAEGVEDEIQSRTLLSCGCDELQGYYFGRPLGPNHVLSFVEPSSK
ncbi:bifunctional diguanylate cyclase/phosphodiesterase [Fusibacter bizertensis]|uniref:Bifunctional diguanylate cyclase/phosphodiesterase n=1 Tax=Fusibacter bizertensis TaxID=1488331 RepID=A0ABT6NBQ8_9FIRM|nr:bifunctional diguanylate cyclase/phosphodiesterase [Fusibacter bizertensis]MDH8677855.1 bifunctional diguanylate cyclase/phosphodiesterase [Fusibacter bizertensis]